MAVKSPFRVGEVATTDAESGLVTVYFEDMEEAVSDLIPVLYIGGWGANNSIPQPGDTVACAFYGDNMTSGVCLGVIYDDDIEPPGEEGQQGTYFEDGSYVYFDRETSILHVLAMGGAVLETPESVTVKAKSVTAEAENVILKATTVILEGTTSIKGNVSIDGNLSVTGPVTAPNI